MLVGVAEQGAFTPLCSPRILEEWARSARKIGPEGEPQARAEIALLHARFPKADVAPSETLERRLWLPDPADIHVLAAAISGSADQIVTLNAKDFPRNILAEEGLLRIDPDTLLMQVWQKEPEWVETVGNAVLDTAQRLSGKEWTLRALMKKARLPRIGKALTSV